jgi:hypothetical protein
VLGEIIIIIKKGAQHRGRIYLSLQICVSSNDVSFESMYYFFLYYRLYILLLHIICTYIINRIS